MMKWMLAAGAAALAIAAPTAAERGGKGGGQERAEKADRGGGKARAQRGGGDRKARAQRSGGDRQARAKRGGGNREFRAARADRGGDRVKQRSARAERRGGDSVRGGERRRAQSFASFQSNRDDRGRGGKAERRGKGRDDVRFETRRDRDRDRVRTARFDDDRRRGHDRDDIRVFRTDRDGDRKRGRDLRFADGDDDRVFRMRDIDRRGVVRFRDVDRDDLFFRRLGYDVRGCPPGLAKKNNGCLPPGQAAKFIGRPLVAASRFAALSPLPLSMRGLYWDDDDYYYRYGGGYLYRVDRDDDLIDGLLPLFGAALIGQPLSPYYRNDYYRPAYFNSFYPNSPYDCYQYGYGYVYETDCASGLVEDVIPTYDYGYGIGQMLPASYSYYNLPYPYRSHFADDDDYYYRYAPGAIYRVDRDTSLITSVAALLGGGLSVGQPLPMGYGAYNVPLGYRDVYYDTPDAWYRYSDGYIYQVDPTTQLVTALVRAIA